MVSGDSEESALGSARGRFLESLPRKAVELRSAVAQLTELPDAEAPREDLRRRLHALYASALVFRNEPLARAVQECIDRLDTARESGQVLSGADFALLNALVKRLPALRDDQPHGRVEPGAPPGSSAPPTYHDDTTQSLLQRVLRVLVLPNSVEEASVRGLLASESLRVGVVDSVAEVVAAVQYEAPDLVLANEQLAYAGGLVAKLRADPTTDFVPVVLYEDEQAEPPDVPIEDVDARVTRPLRASQILAAIGRVTGTLIEPLEPLALGDVTLDALSGRVERELRRGLVDGAESGRALTLSLGEGTEVLAIAHEAIAALRATVVRESQGKVSFEARSRRGGLSLVTLGQHQADPRTDDRRLTGRRIVLVEDDAAVALLLSNQLRAQGATVHEFTDGREARDAALRERPDLVITGARVPNLDGFALCRELARDPLLADVPVMLLPSKDQLLRRPREPGASTELNLEVVEQVVGAAERLLRPRADLEARLRRPGEVRGGLEGTGVIALLRSVRRARPDAHIRIRDAWNLFECELRDGRLAQITRTASDGSFVRNERALPQLLGATAGRFTVVEVDGTMKGSLDGTLDEVLTRGARELAGELDAVSGAELSRIARVVFDEDAYALLLAQTPLAVRQVMERLYAGESPAALMKSGLLDAFALEPILLDLARRGALRGVVGTAGEDLVAEARSRRARALPTQLASPLSIVPPPPNPIISMLPTPGAPAEVAVAGLVDAGAQAHSDASELPPGTLAAPGSPASQQPPSPEAPLSNPQSPPQRVRESSTTTESTELAAAAAEARRSRSTFAGWVLAFCALCALGFFAMRESDSGGGFEALSGADAPSHTATDPGTHEAPALDAAAPGDAPLVLAPRHKEGSLISAEDNGFAVYDGITDDSVKVPVDHALLVIEASPALSDSVVFVNDREIGAPPKKLALPEGVHELAIKRGDAISYRFVAVHPGRTWVLRNP
ncbi:MAG: response regulator [Polyangiales bacterium]